MLPIAVMFFVNFLAGLPLPNLRVILSDLNAMMRDIHFWKGFGPGTSKQAFLKSYLSVLAQETTRKAGELGDPPLPWVRVILR